MNSKGTYQFPFSRYPAVRFILLFISGVLLGEAFSGGLLLPLGIFGVLLLGQGIFRVINPLSLNISFTFLSSVSYLLLIVVFGWVRIELHDANNPRNYTLDLVSISGWEQAQITGVIESQSLSGLGKPRLDVAVLESAIGKAHSTEPFKSRVLLDHSIQANLGDTIVFKGTIIPISDKRNPHDFNYKQFLASRDIHVQLSLDSLIHVSTNNSLLSWSWWQNKATQQIKSTFSDETAPLASALLLGLKQDLDQSTKQAFARSGLSHIMAVSGLHVGFILAPIWFFLPNFRRIKRGEYIGLILVTALLFIYAGITGFSTSVMRASVTATFLTFGKLFNKSPNSINLTAAAAIVLLMINPEDLFNIGFQLSFSAVFLILFVLPVLQSKIPYWIRIRWYGKPIMVILVSIVVQLGLYPIQAFYFGEVSIISPIANALFVPLLGVFIPIAFLGILISPFSGVLNDVLCLPLELFLGLMHQFVFSTASQSWAWLTVDSPDWLLFPIWISIVLALSAFREPQLRNKLIIVCMALVVCYQSIGILSKLYPSELTVTYFDVGQGDAALIQTPNGANVLIDTGVWRPGYNAGKSIILPHLQAEGITKLDAVILSHPHADHIGGILELMRSMPIDAIYNSGFAYDSRLYENYLELADSLKIPVSSVTAGDVLPIDGSVLFLVLGPEGGRFNADPNQHSIVLEVVYNSTEFLFTGDADEHQEQRLLDNYSGLLDTDVLKVAHHGSRTSSSDEFISVSSPEISVISLAAQNRFNHPHPEAIRRIRSSETQLLFTSREKAIVIKSDGTRIWQVDWN